MRIGDGDPGVGIRLRAESWQEGQLRGRGESARDAPDRVEPREEASARRERFLEAAG